MYSTIIVEKNDRVAKITLNRPKVRNAINVALATEMIEAIDELERDSSIDVAILTGAPPAFCAGHDMKSIVDETRPEALANLTLISPKVRSFGKPIIAAVNGYAITGGLELALNCDIIIASEKALFADTHMRLGLIPSGGSSQILPRLVGMKKAKEMCFTGGFVTAQEALQFGMVSRVVKPEELDAIAEKIARDIVACDQVAVRKMKQIMDRGAAMALDDAFLMERYEQAIHHEIARHEVERRRQAVVERGRVETQDK